jgi:hypothetical protein
MTESWIDFAFSVIGGGMALLFLFDGTRRLAAHGAHRRAALMMVLAAIACAFYGTFAYWKYLDHKVTLSVSQRKAAPSQLPPGWGRSLSPEKRESSSLSRARHAFVESGTIATYFDRNGEIRPFAPNLEDVQRRERVVAHYVRVEYAVRNSLAEALLWLILGPVAILFGLVMSLDKGPRAGPGVEGDLPSNGAHSSS